MIVVFEQVLIMAFFAVVGYILSIKGVVDNRHSKMLSALIVYVFMPCLSFKSYAQNMNVEYIKNNYMLLITSTIILIVLLVLLYLVPWLFSGRPYDRYVYLYSMLIPNFGFFAYILAERLFGPSTLLDIQVFCMPLNVYVYCIGVSKLTKSPATIKGLFHQPAIIAMIVGAIIGFLHIPLPDVVISIVDSGGKCVSPIAMLLTGMVISEYHVKPLLVIKKHYIVAAIRMIVVPVLLALVIKPFCSEKILLCALLLYTAPCGLNTVVFPRLVNENCKTGASLALISNMVACITIPVIFAIFL